MSLDHIEVLPSDARYTTLNVRMIVNTPTQHDLKVTSARNLKYMRAFAEAYPESVQQPVAQIKNYPIVQRVLHNSRPICLCNSLLHKAELIQLCNTRCAIEQ